jgi:parvulin-like peptidyl-prolyl isomerase
VPESDAEPFGLAAFRLKAGQVSPIVEAVTATYVLRLLKRHAAEMSAFEKERVTWHRALLAQKEQQIFLAWLRDLRARSGVQIHDRTT